MATSLLITKILAIFYTATGLGVIFSPKYYSKVFETMLKNNGVIYTIGLSAVVAGFLITSYHNVWVKDWRVVITIIGWIIFIKGVTTLMFPDQIIKIAHSILKEKIFVLFGALSLALGLVLGYFGYLA
jgi:uncharacterized protein YjeT (DUF2065 family)